MLVALPGGLKLPLMEAQALCLIWGVISGPGGHARLLVEVLRSLVMDFLAKVRAEVDQVIFFGLGLKVDASSDIRRRMGRVFSRLGLKPKLLFGFKLRGGI